MVVRFYAIFVIIILSIMITELPVFAIDEAKVVTSAEKIVNNWTELLPKGHSKFSVYVSSAKYWIVRKFLDVSVEYDVQKTDSIVSPYLLIVRIELLWLDNDFSPNANATLYGNEKMRGFKTEEDASAHTESNDFFTKYSKFSQKAGGNSINVYYLYRGSFWECKGPKKGELGSYIISFQEEVFGGDVKGPDGHLIESLESDYCSKLIKNIPIN